MFLWNLAILVQWGDNFLGGAHNWYPGDWRIHTLHWHANTFWTFQAKRQKSVSAWFWWSTGNFFELLNFEIHCSPFSIRPPTSHDSRCLFATFMCPRAGNIYWNSFVMLLSWFVFAIHPLVCTCLHWFAQSTHSRSILPKHSRTSGF